MAKYPAAQWRPLAADETYQGLMTRHDGIICHTMVGSLSGTDTYFKAGGYSGTESHFGVGHDGTVYQWVDTDRRADANLDGTYRLLSIETADTGEGFPAWTGSNVPPWTPAQVEAIAGIIAWAAKTHDFPIRRMESSLPTERGVGWHRLGIDGNFPAGLLAGRVSGGEAWSTSGGKVCPGDQRIVQVINQVLPRAAELLRGGDDMQDADFDRIKTIMAAEAKPITAELESLRKALSTFRANEVDRDAADAARSTVITDALARVEAGHMDPATREQVRRLREALMTKLKETPA